MPMIYLSYAREDEKQVQELYERLSSAGFEPWIGSRDVRTGEDWLATSGKAIYQSDFFLSIRSTNTEQRSGHFDEELAVALDIGKEKPPGEVFLIPVRLEDCEMPESLQNIRWVDLFTEGGWDLLLKSISTTSPSMLERPEPPQELVEAVTDGNCVLFVGSGLSARAGFPTWKAFVKGLLDWAINESFIDSKAAVSFDQAISAGEVNPAADSLVNVLAQEGRGPELNEYLAKIFLEPKPDLPDTHHLLRSIPFTAALTTNLDALLERAYADVPHQVYTPRDAAELQDALRLRDFFILKLYGLLEQPDNVLLAPAQYESMIKSNLRFSNFMASLFVSRTILFVGASLDGIQDYLEGIQVTASDRTHYALVAVAGSAWETQADPLRRHYNIQVLPFPVSETFSEVPEFLETLAERVVKRRAELGPADKAARQEPARLQRVQLKNIGPFDTLELELSEQWNILLGDNGVGKSTILRALALAICGKDAQRYANWLIKFGKESGRITLETTDGTQYITDLRRTGGEAEVISRLRRPLDTEGWLAVGFPAYRSVGWQQPKGPQLPKPRGPEPADLLPLMSSDPDPRVTDLKQWIVNLDYQARKESGRRIEALAEDIFIIVNELTEGVTVKFGEVDPETYQITVITDDGRIPIELLSQGTQSIIGWTGILLERLYEVHARKDQPRDEFALVLIDEIGAHMHPAWQQLIVPELSKLFPKVQFIATTHSPLIVSEVRRDQVHVLVRDPRTKKVDVRLAEQGPQGMGAAGLLTSDLFGLSSQLDRTTREMLAQKRKLAAKDPSTLKEEDRETLQRLDQELAGMGLNYEYRDPLYREFLKAWAEETTQQPKLGETPLTREEQQLQAEYVRKLVAELKSKREGEQEP
jgi:hypothetical protein